MRGNKMVNNKIGDMQCALLYIECRDFRYWVK